MSAVAIGRIVRAEILYLRSGWVGLGMLSLVILAPLIVVTSAEIPAPHLTDTAAAARQLLAVGGAGTIAAGFAGSYLVTRDVYYHRLDRAYLGTRARTVFVGKLVAGSLLGTIYSTIGAAVWTLVSVILLSAGGRAPTPTLELGGILLGLIVAGALWGALGCAAGWLIRNYYLSIVFLIVLPSLIGSVTLMRATEVERYLPLGATAGLAGVDLPGLLPAPLSGLLLLGWTAIVTVIAAVTTQIRRRA